MRRFLGIDTGSIAAGAVLVDENGKILDSGYSFHHGKPLETLKKIITSFNLEGLAGAARTSSTPDLLPGAIASDNTVSFVRGALAVHPGMRTLLIAGGEKTSLVQLDQNGACRNYKANSSCAAGTGSFLDQQARRLNLNGIEEFCTTALQNRADIPAIASRCAVFAKTDLIHAQHEGYSLPQICDALALGLARNIVDTLFNNVQPELPLVFAGGVSRNGAVLKHLQSILGLAIDTGPLAHLYGALGSALIALEHAQAPAGANAKAETGAFCFNLVEPPKAARRYSYPPLELRLSEYPDFTAEQSYEYRPRLSACVPVEVDIYEPLQSQECYRITLGIDIGSTSTKAVLLDTDSRKVLAGYYTRTSGKPITAVKGIFEAVEKTAADSGALFEFTGAATTGSGRKFIGKVIGADLVLDEISAHARAAYEIEPAVDTIIEIGGQDSKFTTLKNGQVTFSLMNNVCAAGTGSFIEEQAARLGCSLQDYPALAEGIASPLASDRCTVFMERDINYLLSEGYSVREVLAAVLHAVRDNYLWKVAAGKKIGSKIMFQGATAKNRALVAAFEQKLGKPIKVSKYCHLTGAYGAALSLLESGITATRFRGTGLCRKEIPVTAEVCTLCNNHCKLRVVSIDGERVAFGFLCGRDDHDHQYKDSGEKRFNFIDYHRKQIFSVPAKAFPGVTVGLPAALYMAEELPLWKKFFDLLSIKTITGEQCREAVKRGKSLAGAEFCAPMAAMYGQIEYLAARADFVFMPYYLEENKARGIGKKQYCYYSQFAASLAARVPGIDQEKLLSPLLKSIRGTFYGRRQLYRALQKVRPSLTYRQVSSAYRAAAQFFEAQQAAAQALYRKEAAQSGRFHIVLAGRPYTILSDSMNNDIPGIIARLGIKVFYSSDLPPIDPAELQPYRALFDAFQWVYASRILQTALYAARTEGVYPVLVTSFKCSPDSFAIEYFKMIMDNHEKPYLILQLDEHDSSLGYETRIEAAIRAFTNHFQSAKSSTRPRPFRQINSGITEDKSILRGKTLLLPNWDSLTGRLLVANLRAQGLDARLLEETPEYIRKSMSHNTGQCIPLNIIAQEVMEYVQKYDLDPTQTALWMCKSTLACNFCMFPNYIKNIFHASANGMDKIAVYLGTIAFFDISIPAGINAYFANYLGGMLRKAACAIRPYELNKGETDRVTEQAVNLIAQAMEAKGDLVESVSRAVDLFAAIKRNGGGERPRVALFGDIYTRYNDVINQDLIKLIEAHGGEVVITPQSEYYKIVADAYIRKWIYEGYYFQAAAVKVLMKIIPAVEKRFNHLFSRLFPVQSETLPQAPAKVLARYGVRMEHSGESKDNLLKTCALAAGDPRITLFVQASPAFCCPSLITQAMSKKIEAVTGIPVVSIEYDGSGSYKNDPVIPYLKLLS